ncbi:MAG: cupredoxin domain-containing protein [Acidiferrobacterales bacterium]
MIRKAPASGRKWLSSIAGLALVLFVLPWSASPASELPVVNLAIKSGHFVPEKVDVPARQKFKLRITNHGPAVEEFESSDLNRENIVLPGATLEIYLGPLEPGNYGFFGDFHPDTARGRMIAK